MNAFRRIVVAGTALAIVLALGCSSEVKIGAVISESGAVAPYGENVKRGMDLALDQVNRATARMWRQIVWNGTPLRLRARR